MKSRPKKYLSGISPRSGASAEKKLTGVALLRPNDLEHRAGRLFALICYKNKQGLAVNPTTAASHRLCERPELRIIENVYFPLNIVYQYIYEIH